MRPDAHTGPPASEPQQPEPNSARLWFETLHWPPPPWQDPLCRSLQRLARRLACALGFHRGVISDGIYRCSRPGCLFSELLPNAAAQLHLERMRARGQADPVEPPDELSGIVEALERFTRQPPSGTP